MNKIISLFLVGVLVLTVILSGCAKKESASSRTPEAESLPVLEGKSILMVIAPKEFRDEEFFKPKEIFEEKGAKVAVASTTADIATGMLGMTVKPDSKISDVNMKDYDAIVIVGGIGSKKHLWGNSRLITLVQDAYNQDKIISAICLSPPVLAKASILEGKKATVFPDQEAIDELKKNGATYVNENVVASDRIVTARGPESAKEFGEALVKMFRDKKVVQ
ncbi:MAG: DJ-1/PfpI family protein [Peptococcaceae bacterium]|nr:MAG: DJ-1/PfpI family protein [Peptococcaceae bacterium]